MPCLPKNIFGYALFCTDGRIFALVTASLLLSNSLVTV